MFKQLMGGTLLLSTSLFAVAEQYNLSLNYDPITTSHGVVTTLPASNVDKAWQVDTQAVILITEGVYRISGWGASVWQGSNTKVYAHEWMEKHLLADNGVSPLSGNFNARAVIQFGMLHPEQGPDAFPNQLGFSLDKLSAEKGYLSPDITFIHGEIETHCRL